MWGVSMLSVYPHLCQQIRAHGVSLRELAAVANVNIITLCLSLCGLRRWKLTEAVSICCFFRNPNAEHLFRKESVRFHVITL